MQTILAIEPNEIADRQIQRKTMEKCPDNEFKYERDTDKRLTSLNPMTQNDHPQNRNNTGT